MVEVNKYNKAVSNEISIGVTNKMMEDILEDGKKPMSIRDIKAKYELQFPFYVKLVCKVDQVPVGFVLKVTGFEKQYLICFNKKMEVVKDFAMKMSNEIAYATTSCPLWVFYS